MMMQCMEAGGMDVAYSSDRNITMNKKWGEEDLPKPYFPNDNYYELDRKDYKSPDFPHKYEGKLVKCLWGGMIQLKPKKKDTEGYRIIFMRRSREAIQESMIKAFGYPHETVSSPNFQGQMQFIINLLRDRKSVVSVDEVWYGDVVESPLKVFERLQENGWPIDPAKAAQIPNKEKMRSAA